MTGMEANASDELTASGTDPTAVAVQIVTAFVANNSVSRSELSGLIANVHRAVASLASGTTVQPAAEETGKPTPAQIRKSVTPDALISFLDGKPYKTLKRHLTTRGLDPNAYRQRYGLPNDYPMVAPNFAARRSALAKSIGLGVPSGMTRSSDEPTAEAAPKNKRGRKVAEQV